MNPDKPSKSARKREMHALQALGEQLLQLPAKARQRITMPDELRTALDRAATMKHKEARRRQVQYIGKLMRQVDSAALQAALETHHRARHQAIDAHHALEATRDRLLSEGDRAIVEVLERWPAADRSQLRQLIRAARGANGQAGETSDSGNQSRELRAKRRLFRYLQTLQAEAEEP